MDKYLGRNSIVQANIDLVYIEEKIIELLDFNTYQPVARHIPQSLHKNIKLLCDAYNIEYDANMISVSDRFCEYFNIEPVHNLVNNIANIRLLHYKDPSATYIVRYDLRKVVNYMTGFEQPYINAHLEPKQLQYDHNMLSEDHRDVSTEFRTQTTQLLRIYNQETGEEPVLDRDYTVLDNVFTFKMSYLEQFDSDIIIVFETDYGLDPHLFIEIYRSNLALWTQAGNHIQSGGII